MIDHLKYVDTVWAFEADGKNCEELTALHRQKIPRQIGRLEVVQKAVWSESTILQFAAEQEESSKLQNMMPDVDKSLDTVNVLTISLDEAIGDEEVTHIKMDIEGAEKEALQGAGNIIRKWRPRLLISAYHKPEDLYDLLLLIDSWDLGYRFFFRLFCENGYELVLYAV